MWFNVWCNCEKILHKLFIYVNYFIFTTKNQEQPSPSEDFYFTQNKDSYTQLRGCGSGFYFVDFFTSFLNDCRILYFNVCRSFGWGTDTIY